MIELRAITKTYHLADSAFPILKGIDLQVRQGEFVALTGASGSGKSTLMNILGCLDVPTCGTYSLDGEQVAGMNDEQLAQVRNRSIGFIFQNFNLLPRASAWANVAQPLIYRAMAPELRRQAACEALDKVGLGHRLDHKPNEMSGGQRQRVAIARALVGRPRLVLADEPTGNLDSQTSDDIMNLLAQLHGKGMTIVLVTHEPDIAARCDRVVRLRDGLIAADSAPIRGQAQPVHP